MLVDQGDKQTKLLGTVYHNRISQCNILVDSIDKLISSGSGGDGHALSGQVSTLCKIGYVKCKIGYVINERYHGDFTVPKLKNP